MSNTSKYRQFYYNYIDYKYGYNDFNKTKYKIDDLYTNISKNILQFPTLNDNALVIFNGSNFTNLPFIEFIINYDVANNKYKGFNQVKINEIVKDPLNIYSSIKNQQLQYFVRLKNTYDNLNSNLYYVKQFQEFQTGFKFTDTNFYMYSSNVSITYNEPDISNAYDFSILTYFIVEEFLLSIKRKIFERVNYQLKVNIFNGNSSTSTHISDSFIIYLNDHKVSISNKLSDFILKSIISLDNWSDHYQSRLQSEVSNVLTELPVLFSKFVNANVSNTFQLALVENINSCIYDNFVKKYAVINSALCTLSNKYDFSEDYLVFQNVQNFIMKNYTPDITSLEYITYQFIKSPVQFINSHMYVYNEFMQNNLDMDEIKTTFDFLNDEKIIAVLTNMQFNISRLASIHKTSYSPAGTLPKATTFYARVRCHRLNNIWSDWSTDFKFKTILFDIESTPTPNSINVSLTPLLTLSAFGISNIQNHQNSQWQIATDLEFTNIVKDSGQIDNVINKSTYLITGSLYPNTIYHTRVRYENTFGAWSSWSVVITFLSLSYIDIMYPYDNAVNVAVNPIFNIQNFNIDQLDTDINSHWQIASDINFINVISDSQLPLSILPTLPEIIYNKSINQGCNLAYLDWIYLFIDSSEFEQYLFKFITIIKPDIASRFNINDKLLFEHIYAFRQFFKLMLVSDVYNNILFYGETQKLIQAYSNLPSLFSLSVDDLNNEVLKFKDSSLTNIQTKVSDFYVQTIITNINQSIINSYSI